ncbi:hypothetical protein IWW36_002226 [Coemansia brasiliensis]|uniref:beta-glucosidase n=1 Tax=Coemansia brasiliensis TaxID=2650707 RepID=A0A9W8M182_9FUNG|nr:hypothetical protein IWW36_002226 [Coemansia brasiliensis]
MAKSTANRRRHSAISLTPLAIAVLVLSAQCQAINFNHPSLFNGLLNQQPDIQGQQASRHYVDFHKHNKHDDDDATSKHKCDTDTDSDSGSDDECNSSASTGNLNVNVNLVPPHCPSQGNVDADQMSRLLCSALHCCTKHSCGSVEPTSETLCYNGVGPTGTGQYYGSVDPTNTGQYYGNVGPTNTDQYYNNVGPTNTIQSHYCGSQTVAPTSITTCIYPTVSPTITSVYPYYPVQLQQQPAQRLGIFPNEHPMPFDNGYTGPYMAAYQKNAVTVNEHPTGPQIQPPVITPTGPQIQPPVIASTGPQIQPMPNSGPRIPSTNPTTPSNEEYGAIEQVGALSIQTPRSIIAAYNNAPLPEDRQLNEPTPIHPNRPELFNDDKISSSNEASPSNLANRINTQLDQQEQGNDRVRQGVETEFSETVDLWDQLHRASKTTGLPELLEQAAQARATSIFMPQTRGSKDGLRLDPFAAGGVDVYPRVEQQMLGHDAPGRISDDVWAVIDSLSLEERAGQMAQVHVSELLDTQGNLNASAISYYIDTMRVGTIVDTPGNAPHAQYPWYSAQALANLTDTVQQIARTRGSRVPVMWAMDAPRGASLIKRAAMFPTGTGMAATFDPQHAYRMGQIAAKDARAAGYSCLMGPLADITVDKRWPQTFLSFGEDPALASQMVRHTVRGLQGDYKRDRARVACCPQALAAASDVSDAQLLEYHMPAVQAAVDAGTAALMAGGASINGEALALSPFYQRTLLRGALRFRGVTLSDTRRSQTLRLHAAADAGDAAFLSLNNTSLDVGLQGSELVADLVRSGRISDDRITESAARVLQLKRDLGLFDQPFAHTRLAPLVGARQDIEAAQQAVRESLTLLRNAPGVLPLSARDRVLFVGPHLNSTALLGGGWNVHTQGPSEQESDRVYEGMGSTVMEGVRQVAGPRAPLAYHSGFRIDSAELHASEMSQLVRLARQADKIVVGLGEAPYSGLATRSSSLASMRLDSQQLEVVRHLHTAVPHTPLVALLVSGRPRVLDDTADMFSAVVNTHLPGIHAGLPIAEMLYGRFSPSGRQPLTYPRLDSQARSTIWQSAALDYAPQWPFGFGLSYNEMSYSNLTASSTELRPGRPLTLQLTVHNQGRLEQREPVLLFTSHAFKTGYEPELFRLRRFTKVDVKPGMAAQVQFTLTAEELAYHTRDLSRVIDPTTLNITINALSPNERTISVSLRS